ncbi:MAG: SIS domain-containing protein [Streptomycetales bacterium]
MEPLDPEVMVRQVEALTSDLRDLTPRYAQRIDNLLTVAEWAAVDRVYLTGDGDSYHASCAAEMAFEAIGGVDCEPSSALRFAHYTTPWMRPTPARRTLVIATSASGATQRVVHAIERAKQRGALTLALTGTPATPVTKAAHRALIVDLPETEPSPGIRTYQASLLGLLLIAIHLSETRRENPHPAAQALRQELAELADPLEATTRAVKNPCRELAATIADAPVILMLGSGPSYGTALYSAAKIIEASGVFAAGQDLEEWSHVERFAYPDNTPVFVIAPPGRSHQRAADLAAQAHQLGRHVIAITHHHDTQITPHTHTLLPVPGHTREEFSPLLYHPFTSYLGSYLARQLGRQPFQTDR